MNICIDPQNLKSDYILVAWSQIIKTFFLFIAIYNCLWSPTTLLLYGFDRTQTDLTTLLRSEF